MPTYRPPAVTEFPRLAFRLRTTKLACALLIGASAFAQQTTPAPTPASTRRVPSSTEVGQNTAPGTSKASSSEDAAVVLSPFEVRPEEDSGYKATRSLAGTSLASDL